ncbi:hypothetical protein [Nocardioides sp. YIM 152588]|uniref:SRPBCC family protein n=1 Tax=Nocardioides sp. YIM 152588 TaxID=3158259 RepID=UPI0032E4687B
MGTAVVVLSTLGALALAEACLVRLGATHGSTPEERREPLPGDGRIGRPSVQTDHATTIDAPPEAVWPWLQQMGWGRAGWYTARWVDLAFFPDNGPSADRVVPDWQDLAVGSFVPDGPPETECGFTVIDLEPARSLVLRSTTHLPAEIRDVASVDWTWTFQLTPLDDGGRTRLHVRSRWVTAPWWLTLVARLGILPADFVMSRDMLAGIRARSERSMPVPAHPLT